MNLYNILLVEDDDVDVMGIQRALNKCHVANSLFIARDGVEGLEFLTGSNGRTKIQKPLIILLDLKMPRMDGIEFLEEMRKNDEWKSTPVIVLTTSAREEDIMASYNQFVAGYMVKPISLEEFVNKMCVLNNYWALCEMQE